MHIHLLGYSENAISRILDSGILLGWKEEVTIVCNTEVSEAIPFCPPGISYQKIYWNSWAFDPAQHICMPAVARPGIKKIVVDFFREHCAVDRMHYTSVVHPAAVIASTVDMYNGCFIEPGTVIASFTKLGFGVSVNRGCTIGHHTVIGDYVSINPGAHIAGHCQIGEATQIGMGTLVFDHLHIGSNSIIGGGSVVTKDIPDNVIAWGNPCKVIRNNS